jgi:hypothetical protein
MHDRPWDRDPEDAEEFDEDPEGPQECDLADDEEDGEDIYGVEACPRCGKDVSELAERCPHCGEWIVQGPAKISARSAAFVVLGIFLVVLILVLVF